ncbi:hypothetical protein HYALB_00003820 [Hymenoscyphus albidus]|uniref:Uncharacterized protein n=1 Tax=Hymenoscyphus albidus TaxID=595503 RepID=A0A9N9M0T1_9HELO|nr:hypothetical protein HYALB_00003820 [Hymenoscyphus albidus]
MLAPSVVAVSGLLLTLVAAAPISGVVGLENPQPLAERAVLKFSKTPKKKSKEPDNDDYGNSWGAGGYPRPLPPPPSAPPGPLPNDRSFRGLKQRSVEPLAERTVLKFSKTPKKKSKEPDNDDYGNSWGAGGYPGPLPNDRSFRGLKQRSVEPLAERTVLKFSKTPKKKSKEPDNDDYGNSWGAGGYPRPLPPPPSAPPGPLPNDRSFRGLKRSVETSPKDAGDVEPLEKRNGLLHGVLAAGLNKLGRLPPPRRPRLPSWMKKLNPKKKTSAKAKRDTLFPESLEKRQNIFANLRNAYKNWRARKQSPPGTAQPPRWVDFAGGDRVRRPGGF